MVLPQPPPAVTITFGEEPDPKLSSVDVLDSSGQSYVSGPTAQVPGNALQLRVPLKTLPKGVYTVAWRTVSAVDGHHAAGSFAFGVQVAPGAVATANTAATSTGESGRPSVLAVVARWAFYLGLIALLGAAFVGAVVVAEPIRVVVVMCAVAWPVAATGAGVITLAQAGDAGVGWRDLFSTSLGHALLVRGIPVLATGVTVGALLLWPRRRRALFAAVAATAAASMLGDVLEGHAAAGTAESANVALQWVHIAAGGIWLGGLAALLLAVRGAPDGATSHAVRRFSFGAGTALAAVLVTGVIRAAIEISSWGNVLTTDFGRLVVAKLVLIAALAGLGAINRCRNVPVAARRLTGLRRIGSVELGVAGLAILTAAALVNVAPPATAASSSPPPPAPPLVVTASDYATTVRLRLEVSPGMAGFNTFTAQLTSYDSGAPLAATDIVLSFSFPLRSDLGESTLVLKPTSPGTFTETGANLSLDGTWAIRALVEGGPSSVDIPMHLLTKSAPPSIQVSRAAGQLTIYTVGLSAGRSVQVYLDPQTPGKDNFHATFFDAQGNELTVNGGEVAVTPDAGLPMILPIQQLDPGHYVAAATLKAGKYRFDVSGTDAQGQVVATHWSGWTSARTRVRRASCGGPRRAGDGGPQLGGGSARSRRSSGRTGQLRDGPAGAARPGCG